MKRRSLVFVALFSFFALVYGPAASADGIEIGQKIEDFKLTGIDGKEHSFSSLMGKNGAVLVWVSAQCPVVKAYDERIVAIAEQYEARGIRFIGINSNATESLEWVTSDAEKAGYKFPVLLDKGNVLADRLGATVTPEVYFFNTDNVLLYHGAIDNDRSGRNIQDHFLKTAFDAALSGKAIERPKTNAFGCTIKRVGMEGK
ncbi:MAG TPA: redoxin domain-containing protein [Pyrinomonadaceae bacterium]|nr:redoxin domain-containing protein [Pyrinomonadaceae bacterium]HMP64759.1 redoxin domain-containing protein [Pyrinomonadaceae bacterium]